MGPSMRRAVPDDFERMWADLAPVGRSAASGGYFRQPFTSPERELRAWFVEQCAARGLRVETDDFGNVVGWWDVPVPGARSEPAVLTGSHLDSVLDGGAYDGPLGVVSALAAVDLMRARGFVPARPVGVSVFVEEEGSRFGLACLGSRLATGATVVGGRARALTRPRRGGAAATSIAGGSSSLLADGGDLRRAARRAGPRPRRPGRGGRGGERDLAARALPLRLHRRGQPRRHDPDGGPRRPDADLRDDGAGRQQAGPAGRPAGDLRADRRSSPTAPTPCPSRVTAWLDARCSTDAALAVAGRGDRRRRRPTGPGATARRWR